MSEKRDKIVECAMKLFYRDGIHAVGINRIIETSGIAKKTMYHHFASKEDLILATLELRDNKFTTWFKGRLEGATPGKEAIVSAFYGLDDWFKNKVDALGEFRGCFFINSSAEFKDPSSKIYMACRDHKAGIHALVKEQVKTFQSDDMQAEQIADILCILKEGCITSALVSDDKDAALKALPTVHSFLKDGV